MTSSSGCASPRHPSSIRDAYRAFLGANAGRILLTGHSHQAWPDVARDGLARAFDDAARFVDDKWGEAVFPLAERVGKRVLRRLGLPEGDPITFAASTHELVYRLLSALPRDARVVTTTSEFHSLHRQLSRLAEDGLRVQWIDARPRESVADRLLEAIRRGTDLVAVSAVFFEDAFVLPRLGEIQRVAAEAGATMLVDAYHAFNVVPVELETTAFVTAGGYKYAQLGEGVCFLRSPEGSTLRPRFTGWFADFASLERPRGETAPVGYGAGGARFAGATFDPSSLYRADAVLDHFEALGLDVPALRAISVAQTGRIVRGLTEAGIELLSSPRADERGGFVAARVPGAHDVTLRLRARGVFVDARGDSLRLGPAPYLTDGEIDRGIAAVVEEIGR